MSMCVKEPSLQYTDFFFWFLPSLDIAVLSALSKMSQKIKSKHVFSHNCHIARYPTFGRTCTPCCCWVLKNTRLWESNILYIFLGECWFYIEYARIWIKRADVNASLGLQFPSVSLTFALFTTAILAQPITSKVAWISFKLMIWVKIKNQSVSIHSINTFMTQWIQGFSKDNINQKTRFGDYLDYCF